MRLLALCALAGAVWAQAAPIDRGAIDMMPGLTPETRTAARRAHDRTKRDFDRMDRRLRQIDARLKQKPPKAEADKLRRERNELNKKKPELSRRFRQELLDAGLTEAQLERLKRMPQGRLRAERYNHGAVLEAPGLSAGQRRLLEQLVAATDAAQLALTANREHTKRALKDAERIVRRQVESRANQQIRETEKRFWRIAYYALTKEQMLAVHGLLSPRYSNVPQPQEQMMLLPDLTPSQASRIRSLFTEHESEATADQAEIQQCRAKLRDKSLAKPDRDALNRRIGAAYGRLGSLRADLRKALHAVLTKEQLDAYHSAPPYLNVGERNRPPWEIAKGMTLRADQPARVQKLQRASNVVRRTLQGEGRAKNAGMMGEIGPESPQQMTMMVVYRGIQGRMQEHFREAGRTFVVEILHPDQVCAWVVAP